MFTIIRLISLSDTVSDGATKMSILNIDMRIAQLIVPRNLNLIGIEYFWGDAGLKRLYQLSSAFSPRNFAVFESQFRLEHYQRVKNLTNC